MPKVEKPKNVTSPDITERKRAEEELKLRAQLLDGAIDSIFLQDFDGNFIYVNEAAGKAHGYSRKELMKIFAEGLEAYRAQKWTDAKKHFKAVLKLDKHDGPSKTYLERIRELRKAELPRNWNGVYALNEK